MKNENRQLQEEVIAVHDSIMPKMGLFVGNNLKVTTLLTKMDSLKQVHPDLDTSSLKQQLVNLQTDLKLTNEAMTDWMHNFDPEHENKKPEEVHTYLQEQLQAIRRLKDQFSATEQKSQHVLATYRIK
ncbi:hypothetical protein GCM10023231_02590 [Olivibacter ginsenosidimutans]|uniref:Transposase n=2 Tax=Olivibacter ginsenosidimutans TaxID=1176537 RepID=A0ABP9AGH5_9SPHI